MSLDELLKIIEDDTFICVRINHKDAATEYYYPNIEILPKEWNQYRILSMGIIQPTKSGIHIDVEEVEND